MDNCEICHGTKGGVEGNENVINGVVVCDYCHTNVREITKAFEAQKSYSYKDPNFFRQFFNGYVAATLKRGIK